MNTVTLDLRLFAMQVIPSALFTTYTVHPHTVLYILQGFWYFAEKKAKFRGIFRGKFAEKSEDFVGFSREKSQNSQKNRPISWDFSGRKAKIRRKIDRFCGILAEKSQISKDFQGQIVRKIGRSHGKFRGKLHQETIGKKQPISLDFFWQISLKSINFASIWPALFNVFLTGIIICSFKYSSLEKWANAKTINLMVSAQFFATFI